MPTTVPRWTSDWPGDPTAPDWSDAQADWSSGTYQALAFERVAVDAAMRERSTLMP